jgi:hypothetical protein
MLGTYNKASRDRWTVTGQVWLCLDALLVAQDMSCDGLAVVPGSGCLKKCSECPPIAPHRAWAARDTRDTLSEWS